MWKQPSPASPALRRSSHNRCHSQDRLTLFRIQGAKGVKPDALLVGKSLHVIEL
jgi:hypothetical protein